MSLNAKNLQVIRDRYHYLKNYRSDDLDELIDPLTFVDPTGDSLLHIAACAGDLCTVELLVRAGVDVDQIGDMGCTALHYAKMKRKDDVYSFLVAQGASTLIRNEFGLLPAEVE